MPAPLNPSSAPSEDGRVFHHQSITGSTWNRARRPGPFSHRRHAVPSGQPTCPSSLPARRHVDGDRVLLGLGRDGVHTRGQLLFDVGLAGRVADRHGRLFDGS